ncbi:hypothetical protein EZS27_033899 [termite gut metagenome]|uniref:Uncharacterized protein n=1 Tax=termite gut metagenome TaxID=433724 RepID=A0A5J4Q1Z2_9ZZZZ
MLLIILLASSYPVTSFSQTYRKISGWSDEINHRIVRSKDDGSISGYTVKQYWEKEGAVIVKCNDVPDPNVKFHTESWKIRTNISNPK